jgi:hypothetical protein
MKIFKKNDYEAHISKEVMDEFETMDDMALEMVSENSIKHILTNPLHRKYIEAYSRKNNLKGFCLLYAHGDTYHDVDWGYEDKGKIKSVQKWIDKNDGKFSALLLKCCNPYAVEIKSKKSIILVPNEIYSGIGQDTGNVQVEIYVPKIGYLDDYVIEDEIKKLETGK